MSHACDELVQVAETLARVAYAVGAVLHELLPLGDDVPLDLFPEVAGRSLITRPSLLRSACSACCLIIRLRQFYQSARRCFSWGVFRRGGRDDGRQWLDRAADDWEMTHASMKTVGKLYDGAHYGGPGGILVHATHEAGGR